MRLFIEYSKSSKRLKLDTSDRITVGELKSKAADFFHLDLRESVTEYAKFIMIYAGCELQEDWILQDIAIPTCSTLKCDLVTKLEPDFHCLVKFKKEKLDLYETGLDPLKTTILELRIFLSNLIGLPLSIFRLKTTSDVCMYDNYTMREYYLYQYSEFVLETWNEWDEFLQNCVKGLVREVIDCFNKDVFIKQFQMRVALYIAAFYGNQELTTTMIQMGVRADKPVGEHPCRQWCQKGQINDVLKVSNRLELENLKCPIHVAVTSGQLKIIMQIFHLTSIHVLQKPNGFGIPPWRLALQNKHKPNSIKNLKQKEVAHYLIHKTFERRIGLSGTLKVTIPTYCKLIAWAERAKEKVNLIHGPARSSLSKLNGSIYKTGLLGNKVLMDGFNNDFKDYQNSYDRLRKNYKYYYFIDDEEKARLTNESDNLKPKTSKKTTRKVVSRISDYSDIEAKVESWNDFAQMKKSPLQTNQSVRQTNWRLNTSKSFDTSGNHTESNSSFGVIKPLVSSEEKDLVSPMNNFNKKRLSRQKHNISFDTSISQSFNTFGKSSIEFKELNAVKAKRTDWKKGSKSFDSSLIDQSLISGYNKSSVERAKESLALAYQFKNKTWLQQVRIGSKIAMNDFKKSRNEFSLQNVNNLIN